MPTFRQFELIDDFKSDDFEKLPDTLRFDKNIKEEGKLFRLLIGSLKIKNNITDEVINQKTNYLILGKKENKRFSSKIFTIPFSTTTTINDIDEYLKKANPKNIPLFEDLINEYCYYFYYKSLGIHILSFLHIYRILERMSYTFPMLYASKATDYIGTFNKLQNYFKDSNSELKFFDLFINDYFADEFLEYKVRIDITAHNEHIRESYFKVLKILCGGNNLEIKEENEFTDITIENKNTLNLLIHLRNRYFHFLSGGRGQRNIKSAELIEPDHFYGLLNEHFANWLAVVYFQIIKNEIE
jgi:hypothetical protein